MKTEEFTESVLNQLGRCEETLVKKAKEYATEGDRLHNFVQAAHLQGISPRQALAGMMAKHTVSVYDMAMSDKEYPLEVWDEKIGDHLNYLLILRAMVEDASPEMAEARDQAAALAVLRDKLSSGSTSTPKSDPEVGDIEDSKGYNGGLGAIPGVPLAG